MTLIVCGVENRKTYTAILQQCATSGECQPSYDARSPLGHFEKPTAQLDCCVAQRSLLRLSTIMSWSLRAVRLALDLLATVFRGAH